MNKNLAEIVNYYATRPHIELAKLLLDKSKDNLIACLTDLLTAYMNDKNSSALREFITVSLAGYEHNAQKLGYNGYKHSSDIGGQSVNCEAKPKNITTENYEQKTSRPKLNGEGGFNDYTYARWQKDQVTNLNLLSSGFIDGELQYILEFPFAAISDTLKDKLIAFYKKLNCTLEQSIDLTGQYLRTAAFSFKYYNAHEGLKIIYVNKIAIQANQKYFNKDIFNYLIKP